MEENEFWGPWIVWCPSDGLAIPDEIQPGVTVMADLVVRPAKLTALPEGRDFDSAANAK